MTAKKTAKKPALKLTIGPVLYNWESDRFADFYARIADEAPVDRVYVGEVVCSKREPMRGDAVAIAAERLERGGKEVVLSTLALVTLKRERRQIADLASGGAAGLIEANDVTALAHLGGRPHIIGPFLNVYNEGTLARLAEAGAATVCLPPELPIASIAPIAAEANARQVETEIFAFGRVPLAVSARCYHARVHGLAKDSCQYVCDQDADGLDVDTLDGQKFLAVNGIQTLSQSWSNLIGDIPELIGAGVGAFRLSPQTCDMVAVAKAFRDVLDKRCDPDAGAAALADLLPDVIFSNGFLRGEAGAKFAAVG